MDLIIKFQRATRKYLAYRRFVTEKQLRMKLGGYLTFKYKNSALYEEMNQLGDETGLAYSQSTTAPQSMKSGPVSTSDVELGMKQEKSESSRQLQKDAAGSKPTSQSPIVAAVDSVRQLVKETLILTERNFVHFGRERRFHMLMISRLIMFSVLIGVVYLRIPADSERAYDRVALLFYIINAVALNQLSKIPFFYVGRALYERESQGNFYGAFAFQFSSFLADSFSDVLFPIISTTILYPLTNLQPTWSCFFFFIMVMIFFSFTLTAFLKFLAAFVSFPIHQALTPVLLGIQTIFAGFFIKKQFIPKPLLFLNYLSVYKYCFESLFYNEFDGATYDCPSGKGYCSPKTGAEMIESFDFVDVNKFENAFILLAFTGGYLIVGFIGLRFFKKRSL
jgi:hypothetical protein